MGFLVKLILGLTVLGGGSVLAARYVPPVREQALSLLSPYMEERQLLFVVNEQLDVVSQALTSVGDGTRLVDTASGRQRVSDALVRAQDALVQLRELNPEQSSLFEAAITRVEELAGEAVVTVVQQIIPGGSSSSTTTTPTTVPQAHAPTDTATPAPCVPLAQ